MCMWVKKKGQTRSCLWGGCECGDFRMLLLHSPGMMQRVICGASKGGGNRASELEYSTATKGSSMMEIVSVWWLLLFLAALR